MSFSIRNYIQGSKPFPSSSSFEVLFEKPLKRITIETRTTGFLILYYFLSERALELEQQTYTVINVREMKRSLALPLQDILQKNYNSFIIWNEQIKFVLQNQYGTYLV